MTISVKAIEKAGLYGFRIQWSDGQVHHFSLSELQRHCTCAGCAEKGRSALLPSEQVRARKVASVGRYALRIEFFTGCSAGIYDYELLRKIGRDKKDV